MLCASLSLFGITEIEGGFPHSEIRGSKLVRSSPRLIAAYHVLHRLSAPRHPPNTLKALDRSHYRCPPLGSGSSSLRRRRIDRKTSLLQTHPRTLRSRDDHSWLLALNRTLSSTKSDRMHFLFTMTDSTRFRPRRKRETFEGRSKLSAGDQPSGGARRDRTDDLMLAKHALSQLSYGPEPGKRQRKTKWWAWEDLNFRPHAYQARALTN
jgi:hypothetical protein